jgi:flagellar hook-basal body complex protein FliE
LGSVGASAGISKAAPALGGTAGASGARSGPSFLELMQKSLEQVNQSQQAADTAAVNFQTGQNGTSLEDAMVSMQKANISFQAAVQVRNRMVSAYTDVMNMQI